MCNLVSRERAMALTGHRTLSAFNVFVWRLNKTLPEQERVIRIAGRYDLDSLKQAIAAHSQRNRKAVKQ